MTRSEFSEWLESHDRTESELAAQMQLMGLPAPSTEASIDDLRNVLRVYAASQDASWEVPSGQLPAGWEPPASPAPTEPEPAPAPAPVATPPAPPVRPAVAATPPPTAPAAERGIEDASDDELAQEPDIERSRTTPTREIIAPVPPTRHRDNGLVMRGLAGAVGLFALAWLLFGNPVHGWDRMFGSQYDTRNVAAQGSGSSGSSSSGSNTTSVDTAAKCPGDHEAHAGDVYDVPAGCSVKGDIAVSENGQYVNKFDDDPATGLLVSCPSGCKIKTPFGANVSPRTVDDLKSEMMKNGCEGNKGCKSVKVITIGGPAKTASNSECGLELKPGDVRTIASGCIIVGDVFARKSSSDSWTWTTDQEQNTGSVQKLSSDFEIRAPFGAAVYDRSYDVQALTDTTKELGCHTGNGCTGGVKGWIKTP